jgi:putative molybdenum carrier protein
MPIRKIVSGGQTGIDRAALDVAQELQLERGGWCPLGRLAEDGVIPNIYPLRETATADYAERTELNVRDSDGTLILTIGPPIGGTRYTIECTEKWRKPCYIIDLTGDANFIVVRSWITDNRIAVLNVAGPRQSQSPEGYQLALQFLRVCLAYCQLA